MEYHIGYAQQQWKIGDVMELFWFGFFLWGTGWLFSMGYMSGDLEYTKTAGTEKEKEALKPYTWVYVFIQILLIIGWPHFLGRRLFKHYLVILGIYKQAKK